MFLKYANPFPKIHYQLLHPTTHQPQPTLPKGVAYSQMKLTQVNNTCFKHQSYTWFNFKLYCWDVSYFSQGKCSSTAVLIVFQSEAPLNDLICSKKKYCLQGTSFLKKEHGWNLTDATSSIERIAALVTWVIALLFLFFYTFPIFSMSNHMCDQKNQM